MANKKAQEVPKVQYDPKKEWQWKIEDKFEFTGMEFHKINSALTEFITAGLHDVPTILKLAEAFTVLQSKMVEYVGKGIITEKVAQAQSE